MHLSLTTPLIMHINPQHIMLNLQWYQPQLPIKLHLWQHLFQHQHLDTLNSMLR